MFFEMYLRIAPSFVPVCPDLGHGRVTEAVSILCKVEQTLVRRVRVVRWVCESLSLLKRPIDVGTEGRLGQSSGS